MVKTREIFIITIILFLFGAILLPTNSSLYVTTSKKNSALIMDSCGINNGLIGYWSFNEGEGTQVYDDSGNDNEGTIYGATWTTGIYDNALDFNGETDLIDIDIEGTNVYTYSFWVKPKYTITKDSGINECVLGYKSPENYVICLGDSTSAFPDETICIHGVIGPNHYRTGVCDKDITHTE